MCSIAFSPLVQAYLSRFLRLVWRINQPFVPRNIWPVSNVCSLPVSEVRLRFFSRSFRRRSLSSHLSVHVQQSLRGVRVSYWTLYCTEPNYAHIITPQSRGPARLITPRAEAWGRSIFEHFSSIAHERQNVDDGRTMIYIYRGTAQRNSLVWAHSGLPQ